jgi:hypothetical protein
MVLLLSVRCLNCNNVDEFPRMDFEQIPFCSQCAATSNLVPETPSQKEPILNTTDDELTALFARNLNLTAPAQFTQQQTSTFEPNYSISQHYIQPTSYAMDSDDNDPAAAQLMREQQTSQLNGNYASYLMSTNPGSSTSLNELEIALAHGAISAEEYRNALEQFTVSQQLQSAASKHQEQLQQIQAIQQQQSTIDNMMDDTNSTGTLALAENCSAHDMLMNARRERERRDPVYRSAEWFVMNSCYF